jgi:hypothetical protein
MKHHNFVNRRKEVTDIALLLNPPSIDTQVGVTMDSIVLTIHNKGERPTRYQLEVRSSDYDQVSYYVLDTIIAKKDKSHESLKRTFKKKERGLMISRLNELLAQKADGTREETAENFTPIGLLFMSKESIVK